MPRAQCAFVQFTTRDAAEHASEKTFNRLVIGGKRLAIKWGKSQGKRYSYSEILTEVLYLYCKGRFCVNSNYGK